MNVGAPTALYVAPPNSQPQRLFYSHPQGKPLKTEMAERFPLLSRRERRALLREADKLSRQKAIVS